MIVGFVIEAVVGALCIGLGLVLWIGKKVSVLHSYHYKNVKTEDIPAYARLVGIGLILIGVGIAVTAVLNLFHSKLWWVGFVVGFVSGSIAFIRAQKKYNGSIF